MPAAVSSTSKSPPGSRVPVGGYRLKIWKQAIQALLHMVQFAVAYFIMLWVLSVVWCIWSRCWHKWNLLGSQCIITGTLSSASLLGPTLERLCSSGRQSGWKFLPAFLFSLEDFSFADNKIADLSPRLQLLRNRLCAAARWGVMKSKGVWRKGADLLEFWLVKLPRRIYVYH